MRSITLPRIGFKISIVNDSIAETIIFSLVQVKNMHRSIQTWQIMLQTIGAYSIYTGARDVLNYGHMYVDTQRANLKNKCIC